MEGEEAKLFVGGITWDTTEETLRDHFSKYGDVTHAVVMHDKLTGRLRGFGFVIFSHPSSLDASLRDQHTVDGRLGLAKYVERSGKLLEEKDKKEVKAAELEEKRNRVRMWPNFVPPALNS